MKRIITILLIAMCVSSCLKDSVTDDVITFVTPHSAQELFMAKTQPGVYQGGIRLLEFEKEPCQLILNYTLSRFTVQSDDNTRAVSVVFPGEMVQNAAIHITVEAVNISGLDSGEKSVAVVKMADDAVWLWDNEEQIGYVILKNL